MNVSKPPTIVLDGVCFETTAQHGIGRVWSSLLQEWSGTEFAGSVVILNREGTAPELPGFSYERFSHYSSDTAAAESFRLEDACRRLNADLFVSTHHTTPLETPSALMVHDTIPETLYPNSQIHRWIREKRHCTHHADAYIFVSHNTRSDLIEHYPFAKDAPSCVAHNGVSKAFRERTKEAVEEFKKEHGIDKPYFLCVGSRDFHKNATLFFRAFSLLPEKEGIAIICSGGRSELEPQLRAWSYGCDARVISLSDEDLNRAYAGALALVYPSMMEGFGLPIVEAMASGCPVITCRNSAIPEVSGDCVLYAPEIDPFPMRDALISIQDPQVREPLVQAGLQRAKLFSWSTQAKIFADFLTDTARSAGDHRQEESYRLWRELREYERICEAVKERPPGNQHQIMLEKMLELEARWLQSSFKDQANPPPKPVSRPTHAV